LIAYDMGGRMKNRPPDTPDKDEKLEKVTELLI